MNPPQAFPEQRVPSFNRFLFLNSFILHLFPPPGTLDGNFQNLFLHKILAALGCSEELKGLLKKKKCSWICIYLFILFKTEGFNKSVKFNQAHLNEHSEPTGFRHKASINATRQPSWKPAVQTDIHFVSQKGSRWYCKVIKLF